MGRGRRAAVGLARRLLRPKPRWIPPNPRLVWLSPMPPAPTGIASYANTVLQGLQRIGFRDRRPIDVLWPVKPRHEWLIPAYRMGVYHLGNNVEFHQQIYRHAITSPGLVVLHDLGLDDFVRGMIGRGEPVGLAARREATALAGRMTLPEALENEPLRIPWAAHAARHARGIVVHSEFCRRYLEGFGCQTPIFVVPHPMVESDRALGRARARGRELRAEHALGPDDVLIVAPGDLNDAKQLPALLAACARLEAAPRVHVALVGRRISGSDVDGWVARSGFGERVTVATDVTDAAFLGWIAAADICVDLRFPHRGEVSGSLSRVMQLGRPAIVSATGAYRDVPGDAVVRVAPGPVDTAELGAALGRLVEDPDLRRGVGANARAWVEARTAGEATARGYEKAIEATLSVVLDAGRRALARWSGALLDVGVGPEHLSGDYGLSYARALEEFQVTKQPKR